MRHEQGSRGNIWEKVATGVGILALTAACESGPNCNGTKTLRVGEHGTLSETVASEYPELSAEQRAVLTHEIVESNPHIDDAREIRSNTPVQAPEEC